jgi:hypothetical protein
MVKFIDNVPDPQLGGHPSLDPVRRELRDNPGAWAEVARYPDVEYRAASNRALSLRKAAQDIESTIRKIDGDVVVYARAVTP